MSLRDPLARAVARRTSRRLQRVKAALGRPPVARASGSRAILRLLGETLADLPADVRERFLCGPDLRGFLGEVEVWIDVARQADRIRGPLGADGAALPRGASLERLFDLIARTERLVTLLPSGRIDRGFATRAARFARRSIRQALSDLGAAVLGARLAHACPGPAEMALEFREDPEQARPEDRIDLGCLAGPAGALAIVAPGRRRRRVRARLTGGLLTLGLAGAPPVYLPGAGSRLRAADFEPAGTALRAGGRRAGRAGTAPRLARRELIPGTSILLAPALKSSPRRLAVGKEVPGLGARLALALRVIRLVWPEAHHEVEARTFMVVPVRERRLVSYSLASRPGVSFINVIGKTTLDLADDLLHEAAHHRLHAMQEIEAFLVPGPEAEEAQAFDSPWRDTRRPLHGLLHGCYTFVFRVELFRRVLRAARAAPRPLRSLLRPRGTAWVRRELGRENRRLARALRELRRAGRAGLLTSAGRRLLRSMSAREGLVR